MLRSGQFVTRDQAINDLTGLVKRSLDSLSGHPPRPDASQPHPIIPQDLMDGEGNLRASDIGITWAGPDTFIHGVRVVGPATSTPHQPSGPRPATSTPYRPATSTPYQPVGDHSGGDMFAPRQPPTLPACLEIPDTSAPLRRAPQENRQDYRPAAPMQRFNNKSLNWPAWFRHFRAVADVHGWDKNQRALQLVSYLDETAMNVAQELGDDELYDYEAVGRPV